GEGQVIGGRAGLQVVQEPQPLLGGGERQLVRAGIGGRQRRPRRPVRAVQAGGELGDRRCVEQRPDGDLDAEPGPDAGRHPGGEQRVPAEVEEAVVDADGGQPEDLREDLAQRPLARGARRHQPRDGGVRIGCGQGLAVDLAVGGEGEGGEGDEGAGDHVARQCRREGGLRVLGGPDQISDELSVVDGGGGVGDAGEAAEGGFDFAEFDAVAADFDLVVGAFEEFELAVGALADAVAGAVHAGAGVGVVGVGGEGGGGFGGVVEVAVSDAGAGDVELAGCAGGYGWEVGVEDVEAGVADGVVVGGGGGEGGGGFGGVVEVAVSDGGAGDVELAGCAGGYGLEVVVEDVEAGVADGVADGGAGVEGGGRGDDGVGDVVGALRRPVGVDEGDVRRQVQPLPRQVGGQRLARHHQVGERGEFGTLQAVAPGVDGGAQEGGDDFEDGDAVGGDAAEQLLRVGGGVAVDDDESSAGDEGAEHLPDGDVEGDGGVVDGHVVGGHVQVVDLGQQVVDHAGAVDHRPLGTPGGAGREDDVGQVVSGAGGRQEVGVTGGVPADGGRCGRGGGQQLG